MCLLLTRVGGNMGQCGHADPAGEVGAMLQGREQASL